MANAKVVSMIACKTLVLQADMLKLLAFMLVKQVFYTYLHTFTQFCVTVGVCMSVLLSIQQYKQCYLISKHS